MQYLALSQGRSVDLHGSQNAMERSVLAGGEVERGGGIEIPGGDGGVFGFRHSFAIHEKAQGIARSHGGDMVPAGGEGVIPGNLPAG